MLTFVKNNWKTKTLKLLDKNVLYLLLVNTHSLCYSCENDFETNYLYKFPIGGTIRSMTMTYLTMTNITKMIKFRNTLRLNFLLAQLISSLVEEESTYMTKLSFSVNTD